jgi:hypothetical protein
MYIDQVAPQDGVGTTSKIVDVDVPHYFAAIKNACNANGVAFCATIESFKQMNGWPINNNAFTAIPTGINTFKSQLWEVSRHTNQIWQFEWGYMQKDLSSATTQLYNDYKTYSDLNCLQTNIHDSHIDVSKVFVYPTLCSPGQVLSVKGVNCIQDAYIVFSALGMRIKLHVDEQEISIPLTIQEGIYQLQFFSEEKWHNTPVVIMK